MDTSMLFPIPTDRYTLSAVEFWWERCLRRIICTRPIAKIDEQRRITRLLELEKPALRKVMA